MLRTILDASRAVIVHSEAVAGAVREHGFEGPIAKIPHGAWIVEGDRMAYRTRLGLDERTHAADRYLRFLEALQAHRGVFAGISTIDPRGSGSSCC